MGSLVRCYPQQSQHCPRNGEYAYFIEGYKSDTSLKNLNPMSRRATSVVILCFAGLLLMAAARIIPLSLPHSFTELRNYHVFQILCIKPA